MACESYNNVIPAYVDTVLTVKATRDEESAEMVPFIIERASFFDHALHALIELPNCIVNNISLATFYAQKQSQITEFLKNLSETYK